MVMGTAAAGQAFGLQRPLVLRLFGLRFCFPGRFAFKEFKECFHLSHDTPHFTGLRQKAILHHALVHFAQFLADVAQVADNLLTFRLRHG